MTVSETLLEGLTILVVEDDYYLADDTRRALEGAGARVLGPFSDHAEASRSIDQHRPDCALLDVNLGQGADFTLARALVAAGAKVVFVTGYENQVIPPDLAAAPFVQKPTDEWKLLIVVASLFRS